MKQWKKLSSILLTLVLILTMAMPVLAANNPSGNFGDTSGSITINNTVPGKTYKLYRIFDLSYAGAGEATTAAYRIAEKWTGFFEGSGAEYIVDEAPEGVNLPTVTINNETKRINVTEENVAAFAQAALAYATENKMVEDSSVTGPDGATSVTVPNLPLGTYLVYPEGAADIGNGFASVCSLNSTTPDAQVVVKATYPTVDKKIDGDKDEDDETSGKVEDNTASIGSSVPYVIDGEVPDMTGYRYYYYILEDTLSAGLTFNNDVTIKIGGTELGKDAYTVTLDANDSQKITINILNFIHYQDRAGQPIEVRYSATVNQDAVIGNDGNTNTVVLKYSNDPFKTWNGTEEPPETPDPNEPLGETPEEVTNTYVIALQLNKVDGEGNSLVGAKFSISGTKQNVVYVNGTYFVPDADGSYWRLKDGTYTETEPTEATAASYESTEQKYKKVEVVDKESNKTEDQIGEEFTAEGWVDKDGKLTFKGLGNGTYTITELEAPNGYNLLTEPLTVVVKHVNKDNWTATVNGEEQIITESGQEGANFNVFAFDVVNQSGSLLPSTGGIGTTIFYVIGGVLVAGAGILLVTKKRMSSR